ncbi:MAG: hypothetical protein ACI4S2_16535 [Lachnospiraceae bacterium]
MIAFIGAAIVMGYTASINEFAVIGMCAYCIIKLLNVFKNNEKKRKQIGILLIVVTCFFGSYFAFIEYRSYLKNSTISFNDEEEITDEKRVKKMWSFFVGANYEECGRWNEEDLKKFEHYQDISDIEKSKEYQINLVRERYHDFICHPWKFVCHLTNKMKVAWSEFNPIGYGYGNKINDYFLEWHGGIIHSVFIRVFSLISLLLSGLMLVVSTDTKLAQNDLAYIIYMKMFIMGVTIILLLIEVTPKYSSHLFPLYITVLVELLINKINASEKYDFKSFRLQNSTN